MPRNPEEKPTYLQDVVVPKEETREPQGFDLDREFGKGTKEKLSASLKKSFHEVFVKNGWANAAGWAVAYLELFGEKFWIEAEEKHMQKALKQHLSDLMKRKKSEMAQLSYACAYLSLTGERCWAEKQEQVMRAALEKELLRRAEKVAGFHAYKNDVWTVFLAAWYRMLTGRHFDSVFPLVILKPIDDLAQEEVDEYVRKNPIAGEAAVVAAYRILKAHDLKFIPGKGIEIIDTPPQQFQQKPIPPMPEERRF